MSINPKIGRPTFKLVFATHEDAKSWEFGKAFLNFLKTHYPDLFPEFLGHCEPINVPVSDDNPLNSIKPYWVEDMSYWRRKSKKINRRRNRKNFSSSDASISKE